MKLDLRSWGGIMWRWWRCSPLLHKAQAGITEISGHRAVWILYCFHSGAKPVPSLGSQMKMLLCSPLNSLTQPGVNILVIWASSLGVWVLGDLLDKWFNFKPGKEPGTSRGGKSCPHQSRAWGWGHSAFGRGWATVPLEREEPQCLCKRH